MRCKEIIRRVLLLKEAKSSVTDRMDVVARTGQTSASRSIALAAKTWTSPQKETVIFLIQTHGKQENAATMEKECIAILHHALIETEGDPSKRLDGTLKELNGFLKGIFLAGNVQEVHMIIGILDTSNFLHVSHAGRGEAYLVRHGSTTQITEYTAGKSLPAFIHVASGEIEARDMIIFATQRLLRSLTPAQLARLSLYEERASKDIIHALEMEKEVTALATLFLSGPSPIPGSLKKGTTLGKKGGFSSLSLLPNILGKHIQSLMQRYWPKPTPPKKSSQNIHGSIQNLLSTITHPGKKKRLHLLLLATAVGLLIVIWLIIQLSIVGQRSKTRAELGRLVEQIENEIKTADNRQLAGDTDGANSILQRAEERAKQVMDNGTSLFRAEALNLLDQIRLKKEEINNILRLSPRVLVNLAAKNPAAVAKGLINIDEGEFMIFDEQSIYRVILNSLEDPKIITDDEHLVDGTSFSRFKALAFLTKENNFLEMQGDQIVSVKTDDPSGWVSGKDIETYLRYLYILSPERKQIYKYERLNNRYGIPVEYNVNANLEGSLDMAIDSHIYVLKEGGEILKIFRGEVQPFLIRRAPEGILKSATKIVKSLTGNLYILDPAGSRIIVIADNEDTREAFYVRQYILEGEQISTLQDLAVDPDESHLYVLDSKRLYTIDLGGK